jgi:hypothetical protein
MKGSPDLSRILFSEDYEVNEEELTAKDLKIERLALLKTHLNSYDETMLYHFADISVEGLDLIYILVREYDVDKIRQKMYSLKREYNWSMGEYIDQGIKQDWCCSICDLPFEILSISDGRNTAHVDHNHQTNKVRGLLCRECNLFLGKARESIGVLAKAIVYTLITL